MKSNNKDSEVSRSNLSVKSKSDKLEAKYGTPIKKLSRIGKNQALLEEHKNKLKKEKLA